MFNDPCGLITPSVLVSAEGIEGLPIHRVYILEKTRKSVNLGVGGNGDIGLGTSPLKFPKLYL